MCLKTRLFGKGIKKKVITKSLHRSVTGYRKSRCIRWFWLRCPYDYEPAYSEKIETHTTEKQS